jgi:basic amino acid/polyamine antiporter, APA family
MAESVVPSVGLSTREIVRGGRSLARGIGVLGVVVFGVQCISLSSSGLLLFSSIAGSWPGANLVGVLTIAMVFCLFHAFTYAVMGTLVPRAGADYVLASRALSAPLAFMASWTLVIFSGLVAGTLIALIPQSTIPTFLQIFSKVLNNPTMADMAVSSAKPENVVIIGTICTLLAFFATILPQRIVQRILVFGFILGLLAWGIIYFQLASASVGAFPVAWDRFMGDGSYAQRIDLAKSLGMVINSNPGEVTLAGLVMGFGIFYGYFVPTFFAGEVKRPERSLLSGSWISLLLTWMIFVVATLLLQRLVPSEWISAESYLNIKHSGLTMPWIIFYSAILQPSLPLILIVAFAWIYTLINLVQTYFQFTSRIILAWADDHLMPEWVSYVHPQLRSPLLTLLIVAIIAEIGVINGAQGGATGPQINFILFAVVTQLVAVLAITLFPYLKPAWFARAPRIVRLKIGKLPVITLVGSITLLYLLWLILSSFLYPVVAGPVQPDTLIIMVFLLGSGLAWYLVRIRQLKKAGVDIKVVFDSLPEE